MFDPCLIMHPPPLFDDTEIHNCFTAVSYCCRSVYVEILVSFKISAIWYKQDLKISGNKFNGQTANVFEVEMLVEKQTDTSK